MCYLKKPFFILFILLFISCGKMRSENESNSASDDEQNVEKDTTEIATIENKDSTNTTTTLDQNETKGSILSEPNFTKKTNEGLENEAGNIKTPQGITDNKEPASPTTTKTETKKAVAPSNFTIQKILNGCKTGETLTQEELSKNLEIPKDAIKLVKSITKISENEIEIKWNSTWLVEKISDAKFTDGRLKVRFSDNKMYTSGNAIGIKYEKKIYTDLVVYGRAAHIPSVKGFYWQIGKDK
jgi:hypothetical protein